jgi:hypothetical protein
VSHRNKTEDRTAKSKPFVHRLSKENLLQFKDASAEAKLQWLEEAKEFIGQFVGPRKLERWKAFVMNSEKKARDKAP